MTLDLNHEITVVAMVRSLTSAIRRGSGPWLADERVTFLRAELYNRDGLKGWGYGEDAEAARRLTIWFDHIRRAA
jgi:hypothetical protein